MSDTAIRLFYDEAVRRRAAGQADEAIPLLLQALERDGTHLPALADLGAILATAGAFGPAAACYRRILALDPASPAAFSRLADLLRLQDRPREAVTAFRRALAIQPVDPLTRFGLGLALVACRDLTAAAQAFAAAVPYVQGNASALQQMGIAFYNQGLTSAALDAFDQALKIDPGLLTAAWYRMTTLLPFVYASQEEIEERRTVYAAAIDDLSRRLLADDKAAAALAVETLPLPFYLPYQGREDRDLQARFGQVLHRVMARHPTAPRQAERPSPAAGRRLRVGVVSGYFRLHSVWKIPLKGWIEAIDRNRFTLFGYYTEGKIDAQTEAAGRLFDRFVQGPLPLGRWIQEIQADRLDVLVYPEIGMEPVSGHLAALRLAPVQCTTYGHPETSGLPNLDYYLTSELMELPDADRHYTERLVRLPNLALNYRPDHLDLAVTVDRAAYGFAPDETLYWCCQNYAKYLPAHDDVFARIAARHPQARFAFIDDPSKVEGNRVFRRRMDTAFAALGLRASDHCRFLPRLDQSHFLGLTRCADVFLDGIGWSGFNSALEATFSGVPVVTLPGKTMRSRHGRAILTLLDVTETIAADKEDYVSLAVRLGQDNGARQDLGRRIKDRLARLSDDHAVVRALESFLERAVDTAARTN